MTILQCWVHYDEPREPEPLPAPTSAATQERQPPNEGWEHLFAAILDIVEPHPEVYRPIIRLFDGVLAHIPRQFTPA